MKKLKAFPFKLLLIISFRLLRVGRALRQFAAYRMGRLTFKSRPDDIFIVTYPKSGTTLLQMMLHQLKGDGSMDFPHINTVCPWFETELLLDNAAGFETLESPRCFKTHLLRDEIPGTGRYIYILRDIRDVAVSAYHHEVLVSGKDQGLEKFTDRFLRTRWLDFPTWFQHLESWWPHRKDPNVLFLSYEDMITDLEGTIRKVAEFCQIPLREEEMPRILERCSLASMKRYQEKFDPRLQTTPRGNHAFIRSGQAGSGRQLLPRQLKTFEMKLSEAARKLGCERGEPYRELISATKRT
jgi:Sulfotransferase domain